MREVGWSKRSGILLDGGDFERDLATSLRLPVRCVLGANEGCAQDPRGDRNDQNCRSGGTQEELSRAAQSGPGPVLMIDSILVLRFDPVTPETHASGEDIYNLQTMRMRSA